MRGITKDRVYTKYEKESGKLRFVKPNGAWTLNLSEVDPTDFDIFQVITESNIYLITTVDAMTHGFEREHGGERKQVIPVPRFTIKSKKEE